MAHPDLTFIPLDAAQAFTQGQERQAVTLLRRAQASHPAGGLVWAQLERLTGLLLIHVQREVEGTFCLERADAVLDALHAPLPHLAWLEERQRARHTRISGMTDTAQPRPLDSRALENSEQEFLERYAPFAATGTLHPQIEGSPLLEFSAGGRVLYLFDRTGPYTAVSGEARVVIHGLLDLDATELLANAPHSAQLGSLGVSAIEGTGQLVQVNRRTWVVQSRVPLVLSSFSALPTASEGQWVSFRTLPPLHGFLVR